MDKAGAVRIVARMPGNVSLHDLSPDGRLLIARTDDRSGIAVRAPDQATARDLSWLDASILGDISPDGRRILFTETGVGGGPRLSAYLRGTDGSAAVRLGDGFGYALSPDGRWALTKPSFREPYFDVIPTGAGPSSRLERPGLHLARARWLPDGRNVIALAQQAGRPRLFLLAMEGDATRAVTPEALAVGDTGWAVSPDGTRVAVTAERGIELVPIDDGAPHEVPGSSGSSVLAWIESGLLVSDDPAAGGVVFRVDPATGQREPWANIEPQDPAGIMTLNHNTLVVTPDGRAYGYGWHRATSDLYLIDGLTG
jgi:hypothetical protein